MTHTLRAIDGQVYTVEIVGHALTVARCCVARSRVVVLLSEAPLGAEDTDAPDNDVDDDEDEPLQKFRRCLQAMASGKTVQKLRAWRTTNYALKDSRKQGNMKGITRIMNGKQEQGIPLIVPGCPMLTATRYEFKVPLHRFKTLSTDMSNMFDFWYLVDVVSTRRRDRRAVGSSSGDRGILAVNLDSKR